MNIKALWLAECMEELDAEFSFPGTCGEAAAELRRLHEANQELLGALKLADAMLSGANMNAKVVERKVRAAINKHIDNSIRYSDKE